MVFYHQGQPICRKTYLFLHNIGKKRYSNLKASVKTDGVLPRRHGNLRRVPQHAFSLEDTLAFVTNYTEEHGIHLPFKLLFSTHCSGIFHIKLVYYSVDTLMSTLNSFQ